MSILLDNDTDWSPDFSLAETALSVFNKALELEGIGEPCEADITILDGPGIRELNRDYRGIDQETDVLSFPAQVFSPPGVLPEDPEIDPDTEEILLGDIALNKERISSQALAYGHSEKREFAFLISHSVFHLLGYDHETEEEAALMEQKQESVLAALGITRD